MGYVRALRSSKAALSSLLLASAVASASAQQPSQAQTDAIRKSCRSDFMANCSGVQPGGKEALECLKQHVGKLSPACQTAVSQIMPAPPAAPPPAAPPPPPAAVTAPAPPPAAPPPAAPPPMPAQAQPVAPPPAAAAQAQKPSQAEKDAIRQSCRSDFMAHCSGVTPGTKDAMKCLESHLAALSPPCKAAVVAIATTPGKKPPAAIAAPAPVKSAPAAAAPMVIPPEGPPHVVIDAAVVLRACKLDMIRHCMGVQPGGGREVACLAAHGDGLSIRCRAALQVSAPLR